MIESFIKIDEVDQWTLLKGSRNVEFNGNKRRIEEGICSQIFWEEVTSVTCPNESHTL